MRRLLKVILHHPGKLFVGLLCLCGFYGYARILVLQFTIGAIQSSIERYPNNFPHGFFIPFFYTSITAAFFAAIYHDLIVLHSGSWRYVLPLPLTVRGRLYRMLGVPVYAFVIAIVEAVQMYRNPYIKSDLSRLAAYFDLILDSTIIDEHKMRAVLLDIKWKAWQLQTTDHTTLSTIRLPFDVLLAVAVCTAYAISLFCREPRHDGEELREAARNNDTGRLRRVLARGTHPNSRGSDGATALHICAQQAMGALAKVLLEHKANPNIQDRLGLTPLHWAVQMRREETSTTNRLEMIRLLLANGADVNVNTASNCTPLTIARKKENAAAFEVLKEVLGEAVVGDPDASSTASTSSVTSDSNDMSGVE